MKKAVLYTSLIFFVYGCSFFATRFSASKILSNEQTTLSTEAEKYFWDNFHQGNYDSIKRIGEELNFVLQASPNDLKATAHLGFLHVWAIAERQRIENLRPDITEHLFLSRKYFEEAYAMNPHDSRILGFLADMTLAEGSTLNNPKQQTEGYFMGLKAVKQWPQFNKFTLGYVFSSLDTSNKNFKKGLQWQYQTINDCACEKVHTLEKYRLAIKKIKESKDPKISRACWNSWIAPHNWEGFCLNWGDMLVKNGDVGEGVKIYNLAKESHSYSDWPFTAELEERIKTASQNKINFNLPLNNQNLKDKAVIMFNSKMACTGCHQMSKEEFIKYGNKSLTHDIYFLKDR